MVVAAEVRHPLRRMLDSSIGTKLLMALSGLFVVAWLVGHLTGNLLAFAGRDAMNAYAAWLHTQPALLWGARVGMLLAGVTHVATAIRLRSLNRGARPERYRYNGNVQTTLAGRTMMLSGLLILAYVVYHLMHFTWGAVHVDTFRANLPPDSAGRLDVYGMVVGGLSQGPIAAVYIFANALLGLHLSHALSSVFQTLGLTNTSHRGWIEKVGPIVGWSMALGFISVPVAALMGVLS